MKKLYSLLIGAPALAGAAFALAGCVGDGTVGVGVGVEGPAYYDEGPWVYGHPYYHEHDHFVGPAVGFGGGWGRSGGHDGHGGHR